MRKTVMSVLLFVILISGVLLSACTKSDNNDEYSLSAVSIPEELSENSYFTVHYIDVGQADASLVICDGETMLIDGGNKADSRLLYTYLKNNNINYLDYVIATHAHEDHIGGLAGALNYANFGIVYSNTDHDESEIFLDFKKQIEKYGKSIAIPNEGDTFELGSAQVSIISRSESENENDASIVLRIVYGDTSFLFTGDIEEETEYSILKSGACIESTVLKVSHHGSDNSSSYPFILAVDPDYAVISVGDNKYGHPSQGVLKRLKNIDAECYRTDICGNIICSSNGKSVEFSFTDTLTSSQADEENGDNTAEALLTSADGKDVTYIGNKKSGKFHYTNCESVKNMKEQNKVYFTIPRQGVTEKGFLPCGACKP